MEELLANLVPVDQWEWWLWRVTWRDDSGQTRCMWCVSTETHIAGEIDRRWPSSYWTSCTWEPVEQVKAPKTLWCSALRRKYPEDAWHAGAREATDRKLNIKE
jgi:hypothetical protein